MPLTKSKRFEVRRGNSRCLELYHCPSGLPCGAFSHIRVRTFKAALEGVEEAEARLTPMQWRLVDSIRKDTEADFDTRQAANLWASELRRAFPNGAWSR